MQLIAGFLTHWGTDIGTHKSSCRVCRDYHRLLLRDSKVPPWVVSWVASPAVSCYSYWIPVMSLVINTVINYKFYCEFCRDFSPMSSQSRRKLHIVGLTMRIMAGQTTHGWTGDSTEITADSQWDFNSKWDLKLTVGLMTHGRTWDSQ